MADLAAELRLRREFLLGEAHAKGIVAEEQVRHLQSALNVPRRRGAVTHIVEWGERCRAATVEFFGAVDAVVEAERAEAAGLGGQHGE